MRLLKKLLHRTVYNNFILQTTLRYVMTTNEEFGNLRKYITAGVPKKVRSNPAVMKLETPEFRSIFTEELKQLVMLFEKHKYELRIAGGAVRDLLLGKLPKDIDFATTATPDEMKTMFKMENVRMINAKGEKHGTVTPRINNKVNFEVTTLRIDVCTDGRHAKVQFTKDWQLDANRRDLTINSMYLGFDGTLYDYFYGYDDLKNKRVVFVGDASVRVQEDYLRILRYFRFYGRIAENPNNHDDGTLNAIKMNANGLSRISGERIWSELQKIVIGNFAEELILKMISCGVTEYCGLPSHPNINEFKRLCRALKQFKEPHLPILVMISLLHNVEDAIKMHERLKLSAFERDLAFFITQERDQVDELYLNIKDYQKLSLQPNIRREFVLELLKYKEKADLHKQFSHWQMPTFPVNGNQLKEKGCPPGRKMGYIFNQLKLIWIDNSCQLTANELLEKHLPELMASLSTPPTPTRKTKRPN